MEAIIKVKKWLITGGSGQVGKVLASELKLVAENVISYNRSSLDITDYELVEQILSQEKPDIVVNTASWTSVDKAEHNYEEVMEINAYAVENLSKICNKLSIRLVQLSTDYVFSGEGEDPYETDSNCEPKTVYGKSKLLSEEMVLKYSSRNSLIIRTSWVYSENGNNFLKNILRKLAKSEKIFVVDDQIGTPTNAHTLAKEIIRLVADYQKSGNIYHVTDGGSASWFEFAQEIANVYQFNSANIKPIKTEQLLQAAPRPRYSVLRNSNCDLDQDKTPNIWLKSLKEFSENYSISDLLFVND